MFSSIHTSYKGLPPLNQQVVQLSTTAKTMQVKKQQLELDIGLRLVPNWERSISRLYIITLLI